MSTAPDPRHFAEILRNGTHPQWPAAYSKLKEMLKGRTYLSQRWQRMAELGGIDHDCAVDELVSEFWLLLVDNPRMLDAAVVRGYGAISLQIDRFLRMSTSVSLDSAESRLRRHLRGKVLTVLRNGEYSELRNGVWAHPGMTRAALTAEEVQGISRVQPELRANWVPQNPNQGPPVVSELDLTAHIMELFRLSGRPLHLWDICSLAWTALRPALSSHIPHVPEPEPPGEDLPQPGTSPDAEIAVGLQRFLDSLPEDLRQILALRFGPEPASIREIASTVGLSKSSVERRLSDFEKLLATWLVGFDYTPDDRDGIIDALRDILLS